MGLVLPVQTPPVEIGIHFDKEKNWARLDPYHWVHENTIPKTVCHHFWRGLIHYVMSCPKEGGQWIEETIAQLPNETSNEAIHRMSAHPQAS